MHGGYKAERFSQLQTSSSLQKRERSHFSSGLSGRVHGAVTAPSGLSGKVDGAVALPVWAKRQGGRSGMVDGAVTAPSGLSGMVDGAVTAPSPGVHRAKRQGGRSGRTSRLG